MSDYSFKGDAIHFISHMLFIFTVSVDEGAGRSVNILYVLKHTKHYTLL